MRISFHWPITFGRIERLIPLDETNLPTRVVKALYRKSILYLNDVPNDGEKYIRNFGKKCQQYVDLEKKRLGIQLNVKNN